MAWDTPSAVPVDESGTPLIPELAGRTPTHNESFLISGQWVTAASSNVKRFRWEWETRRLYVDFLLGDEGYYEDVPLETAVGFIETMSPGRYVWNFLRDVYHWEKTKVGARGPGRKKPKAQVVRIIRG